jgi:hypothetical protein
MFFELVQIALSAFILITLLNLAKGVSFKDAE